MSGGNARHPSHALWHPRMDPSDLRISVDLRRGVESRKRPHVGVDISCLAWCPRLEPCQLPPSAEPCPGFALQKEPETPAPFFHSQRGLCPVLEAGPTGAMGNGIPAAALRRECSCCSSGSGGPCNLGCWATCWHRGSTSPCTPPHLPTSAGSSHCLQQVIRSTDYWLPRHLPTPPTPPPPTPATFSFCLSPGLRYEGRWPH